MKGKIFGLQSAWISVIFLMVVISARAMPSDEIPAPSEEATSQEVLIDQSQIKRFSTVIGQIKGLYVKDVSDEQLFSSAIQGMLSGLDPHSTYLDEKMLKELYSQTNGEFTGVGVEIVLEKGLVKVVAPIDDTPAQKAGIKAGDYILAIDQEPLIDVSVTDVVRRMRGKPGSTIILTIANPKVKEQRQVKIVRGKIKVQSVKSKLYENGLGYVRIAYFQEQTHEKVEKAIKDLKQQTKGPLKGLVLDLRNNPGGLLGASGEVANLFLHEADLSDNKKIFFVKGRIEESRFAFHAKAGDVLLGAPLIVLINEGSASGSEIVAGALKDHKRAIIMGQRSFGKGSVQTVLPIDDKTAVKLTTALYYTPSGKSIQAQGIHPDVVVEDLKLEPLKEEMLFFWKIREKDLKGYLKNGHAQPEKDQVVRKKITITKDVEQVKQKEAYLINRELAEKDYQLYEALKLLKALHLYQQSLDG
jgi:carboxyl-terminal processing protease